MSRRKPQASLTFMHEFNAEGQHRIVAVSTEGTNSAGEWVEARRLAQHLNLFANADPSNGLPAGIFTVREQAHQVLA